MHILRSLIVFAVAAASVNSLIADPPAGPVRSGPGTAERVDPAVVKFKDALNAAQSGRTTEAIVDYEAGLALRPDFAPARYNLAQLYLLVGRKADALKSLQQIVDSTKVPATLKGAAHFRIGLIMERDGQNDRARTEFLQILKDQPRNPDALGELGAMAIRAGDTATAISYLESYRKVIPDNPLALYNLALLYGKQDRMVDALHAFQAAADVRGGISPAQHLTCLLDIGLIYDRLPGHTKDAVSAFQRVIHFDKSNVNAWMALGLDQQKLGNYDEALKAYHGLLSAAPEGPQALPALFNSGLILLQQRRFPEAAAAFEKVVARQPNNAAAQTDLALAYVSSPGAAGNDALLSKARSHYEKARGMDSKNLANYAGLAYVYELSGSDPRKPQKEKDADLAAAAQQYEELLKRKPHDSEVSGRIISLYSRLQKWDKAIKIAREVANVHPEDPEGWISLSGLQSQASKKEDAIQTLRYYLTVKPDNTRAGLALADLLAKPPAPDNKAAIEQYQRVLKDHPDNFYALQRTGELLKDTDAKAAAGYLEKALAHAGPGEWFQPSLTLAGIYEKLSQPADVEKTYLTMIKLGANEKGNGPAQLFAQSEIAWARNRLASAYKTQPKPDYVKAAQVYEDIYRAQPTFAQPLIDAGDTYELAKMPDAAMDAYARALKHQPDSAPALSGYLRTSLQKQGEGPTEAWAVQFLSDQIKSPKGADTARTFETAAGANMQLKPAWQEDVYNQVLAHLPNNSTVETLLADAKEKGGKWQEALAIYTQITKDEPKKADAFSRKAAIEEGHQQQDAALADYETALRLDPKNQLYAMSVIRGLGRPPHTLDEQRKTIQSLLEMAPENVSLADQAARLCTGPDASTAKMHLYEGLLKKVNLPAYHDAIGDALRQAGDRAGAKKQYQDALAIEKNDFRARVAIQQLDAPPPGPTKLPAHGGSIPPKGLPAAPNPTATINIAPPTGPTPAGPNPPATATGPQTPGGTAPAGPNTPKPAPTPSPTTGANGK